MDARRFTLYNVAGAAIWAAAFCAIGYFFGHHASAFYHQLVRGGLVVALGRPRYLPPSEAHTGGHYVAIVGVSPSGEFIVNDPYRATSRRGRRYRVADKTLAAFVRHKPNGRLFAIQRRAPPKRGRS